MADTNTQPLQRLSDADYEVAPDEDDVRGWDVVLEDEQRIGEIDDLIIEPAAGKVRYLVVDLDRDGLGFDRDRKVLVPISSAELDPQEEQVILSGIERTALSQLPEYDANTTASDRSRDAGMSIERNERTEENERNEDTTTKRLTRSAEELRIGKRLEKKGEVRVTKHVETEHVSEDVPLTREEVHVERRAVDAGASSTTVEMQDDEIVVPVMEEEAVVEKRPVVKEQIVITKEPVTTRRTVEADVQHEEIDVEPSSGDVRLRDDVTQRGGR